MASIKRHASAEWQGSGKDGKGSLTTQSATLKDTPYSFTARFGDGKGTNPEELIAAAHAGCFSMATAFQLSGAGHPPDSLHCDATLTMEQEGAGWKIAAVHLVLRAQRARPRRREIPGTGGGRKSKLPRIKGAERRDHAGREAGVTPAAALPLPSREGVGGGGLASANPPILLLPATH